MACNGGGGGCFFVFVCLMGALGESILQRDLPRRRLPWKDDDVPRLLPFHYVKRESRAIRISACYDKSGSSEKKKVFFYRFVGLSLSFWFFFPLGGFAVIPELFLRVGNGKRGLRGKWAGTV